MDTEEVIYKQPRSRKKLLRVTFPDGEVICYKSATTTMIATLKKIGAGRFSQIKLELCHLPLLSKEVYPRFEKDMKPVCDGWYMNAQSSSDSKYMQLKAISKQFKLGLKIEQGEDFDTTEETKKESRYKSKDKLMVKMPQGDFIVGSSVMETFLLTICHLGIENIKKKDLIWGGRPLVTNKKISSNQVQVGQDWWLTVPSTTRDKVKVLRVIGAMLHVNIEASIIQQ